MMTEAEHDEIAALINRAENMTGERAIQYVLVALARIHLASVPVEH